MLSAAEVRDIKKKMASLERKMNTQRGRVEKAEEALKAVDPYDYQALGEAQGAIQECKDRLSALEEEWLDVASQLES